MMDRSQGHVIADDGFILVEAADARTKGMVTSMFQEWCLSWVQFLTALQILCLVASSALQPPPSNERRGNNSPFCQSESIGTGS